MNREEAEHVRAKAEAEGFPTEIVQAQPYYKHYPNPLTMTPAEKDTLMHRHLDIFHTLSHAYGTLGYLELAYAMDHAAALLRLKINETDR